MGGNFDGFDIFLFFIPKTEIYGAVKTVSNEDLNLNFISWSSSNIIGQVFNLISCDMKVSITSIGLEVSSTEINEYRSILLTP